MQSGIEVNCCCTLSLKISRLNQLLALQMQQICRSLLVPTSRCSPPLPAASRPTSSPPSKPTLGCSTSQPDANRKRRGNIRLLPAQADSQEDFFKNLGQTKTRANERRQHAWTFCVWVEQHHNNTMMRKCAFSGVFNLWKYNMRRLEVQINDLHLINVSSTTEVQQGEQTRRTRRWAEGEFVGWVIFFTAEFN